MLLDVFIQAGTFISAFAGIAASAVMLSITRKFGQGLLARGFEVISWGVIFIATALIIDAVTFYLGLQNSQSFILAKAGLLIAGTYTVVTGAKKIADGLHNLTK